MFIYEDKQVMYPFQDEWYCPIDQTLVYNLHQWLSSLKNMPARWTYTCVFCFNLNFWFFGDDDNQASIISYIVP